MNEILNVCTPTELLIAAVHSRATDTVVLKYLSIIVADKLGESHEIVYQKMLDDKQKEVDDIIENMTKYVNPNSKH